MRGGYGTEQVTIEQYLVGHVAVTGVEAVPALSPRLRFGLEWTLGPLRRSGDSGPAEHYRLVGFSGELLVGPKDLFVGRLARDESRHALRSLDYVDTQQGSVALDLSRDRLERLEACRVDGVLRMKMRLWPRIEIAGETTDARVAVIRFQVPRDDWIAVLDDFTGEQTDLLEIRYHLVYANRFRQSLKELRRARDAVDRGDYNYATLQARKAVGLMEESVPTATREEFKALLEDRTDQRHGELYNGIVSRAKRMGNKVAHAPDARDYTRVEALFAIRLATITVELVAGLLAD